IGSTRVFFDDCSAVIEMNLFDGHGDDLGA
ncbi:hypothetical protein PanWU01x14_129340, partial [Parasponia andersonii]